MVLSILSNVSFKLSHFYMEAIALIALLCNIYSDVMGKIRYLVPATAHGDLSSQTKQPNSTVGDFP